MSTQQNTDVLIIGAGPVGLFAANELHRYGLSCRIIDKKETISSQSKALGLHIRTLDVFKDCGFLDEILKEGLKIDGLLLKENDKTLVNASFSEIEANYHFLIDLPQNQTETIFYQALSNKGITVEWQKELIALTQDKEEVTAIVKTKEGDEQIKAKWLIAADGAHSKVRDCLNLPFIGNAYKETWWLADLSIEWQEPHNKLVIFASHKGPVACFPIAKNRYRIVMTASENKKEALQLSDIEDVFKQRTTVPFQLSNPIWLSQFGIAHRQIENYQHGRIFLAGDAAHIHSPIGGQGLNTGIQDIYNLIWKLALVDKKLSPESLLRSYQLERHPIAKAVLKKTDRMTKLVTLKNPLLISIRNFALKILSSIELLRKEILTEIAELKIAYAKSPIVSQIGENTGFKLGQYLPNFPIKNIKTEESIYIHELVQGTKHHLFIIEGSNLNLDTLLSLENIIKEKYKDLIEVHLILNKNKDRNFYSQFLDEQALMPSRFKIKQSTLLLVRPDKYIGLVQSSIDNQFSEYLKNIFL
ncbi:MAG: FAD-dependent monooxygenase [Proteobacteria bacterium]|nr:FAD-dependent monooxygenase [Pseudomonadota bacterium]